MYPVLFKIGPLTIHTYGFCIALGFLVALYYVSKTAKRKQINSEIIVDLCFYALVCGMIGGRVLYVILEWETFQNNWLEIFRIWNGGLVFYGGFIAALIFSWYYMKQKQLPILSTLDILAPAVALAHGFGRIGCFFAGCCYGRICDMPWAVTFTHPLTLARPNVPLHPTQLYSSLMNFGIFGILIFISRRKPKAGVVAIAYLCIYGLGRFFIEFFRGDDRGATVFHALSPAQGIGIFMIASGCLLYYLIISKHSN
ncbi:MAG: Prolipoprotein diacylglyceryl transferase [Candidatus Magnetoglobus multicellularis str. Araruama]|uniref:Phosphatidylglycerol--prolipoprotein diacylglyceryl transferase n=1 Tax=Candidatus Magnetoglobus multicellularis str. Araruama TaxID=890399 RepID=A0A1V1PE31_9BACT|nr:MAG: Prolipoprotein diacylglyceryl transferase [Candidatus Magnetoglobus multicellularis str. Araruama]